MSTAIDDQRELAATLIDRARIVASDLGARAGAAEEQRHIHAESFRAMKEADLFRAYAPVRFGGYELHPRYFWRIAAEIAKGCPSSSWVYSVMSCHIPTWRHCFPNRLRKRYSAPIQMQASAAFCRTEAVATKVDGGYLLKNSVWPFGSGCHHADWFLLGAQLPGLPPGHDKAFFLVPPDEIEINDDWYVTRPQGDRQQQYPPETG